MLERSIPSDAWMLKIAPCLSLTSARHRALHTPQLDSISDSKKPQALENLDLSSRLWHPEIRKSLFLSRKTGTALYQNGPRRFQPEPWTILVTGTRNPILEAALNAGGSGLVL